MHFIVIVLESGEFCLELALGTGQVDIDGGQFIDSDNGLFVQHFGGSLGSVGLFQGDTGLLKFHLQLLASALGDTELIHSLLQLTMHLIVVGLKLL